MPDPITLVAVGSVALTEGVKFLFSQAGELLKRWRERKSSSDVEETKPGNSTEPVDVQLPEVFAGQLLAPRIHYDALESVEEELGNLRGELLAYVDGGKDVDASDESLTKKIDALRCLLEAVYQQRITFKREVREQSGPLVEGFIDAKIVAGDVAAVRARKVKSGTARGTVKVDNVKPGAKVSAVETDVIGDDD